MIVFLNFQKCYKIRSYLSSIYNRQAAYTFTSLQCNKMPKKKSIQIKTIDVDQMINIKTRLSKPSQQDINLDHQQKITIRHKTQTLPNFGNMLKLAKRQEIIRYKIDRLIKEAETSPIRMHNPLLRLNQFPKRQKSIKNSNPYRYFLSSKSERLPTEDRINIEPNLHINLTKILKERFSIRLKSNSLGSRALTQVEVPTSTRKNLGRKNSAAKRPSNEHIDQQIQPWLMTESQQGNIPTIFFYK